MRESLVTITFLIFIFLNTIGQISKDLKVNYMLPGSIYAGSIIKDSTALGGFGISNNLPKTYNNSLNFSEKGFFLKIDTSHLTFVNKQYNGYKFFIVNKTDTVVRFPASDSRIYVIAEVYYKGRWRPIEFIPESNCGNSQHNLYLSQNEYWEFNVPKYSGKKVVKLLYSLHLAGSIQFNSNEILASINKGQMKKINNNVIMK